MPDLTDEAFALSDELMAIYAEMTAILSADALLPSAVDHLADLLEQAVDIGRRQDENDAARWLAVWAPAA